MSLESMPGGGGKQPNKTRVKKFVSLYTLLCLTFPFPSFRKMKENKIT